jgi:hypothetical protein
MRDNVIFILLVDTGNSKYHHMLQLSGKKKQIHPRRKLNIAKQRTPWNSGVPLHQSLERRDIISFSKEIKQIESKYCTKVDKN